MLARIDLRGDHGDPARRLPRPDQAGAQAVRARVAEILADVRARGDAAVVEHATAIDGVGGPFDVSDQEVDRAVAGLDGDVAAALESAVGQVRWFHQQGRPAAWSAPRGGATMGTRFVPLRRVGCCVPGGQAPLVSTAIMTIVPARLAGVDEVVVVTPPAGDGSVSPAILAATRLAGGADRILRLGGAQAVPAGITEVAIIADDTAQPRHVACDLVAQAEHDPQATALLITPDAGLAEHVDAALADEVAAARHSERIRTALDALGAAVLVDDLDHAVTVADAFAAEHLEVQTRQPQKVADQVRCAGAIFVGSHTPVSLGDYAAGPNHTLPTAGAARFVGGLRTADFLRPVNWVSYEPGELAAFAHVTDALGALEDLPAHSRAVRARTDEAGPE
ncbi:MAG: histidinol dehydrogenase [Actinobacteria bacterium QS_5_72_10]|nr:MAG: histidinol dehydrogenase [Actinobacteria bacterium QS_5_72_10]